MEKSQLILTRALRRTSVTDEITAVAGAEGKTPSRLDFNNREDFLKTGGVKRIVATIDSQIAMLTAYRKSLIHEYVTGQRRVTDEDVRRTRHSERSQPTERRA